MSERASIVCPLSWCEGDRVEHGGDGGDPNRWLHRGPAEPLASVGIGYPYREGAGSVGYYVGATIDRDCTPSQLAELAIELRAVAARLDAIRVALTPTAQ